MNVLVFGDSIAYGAWDEEGGWVERLKRYLHHRTTSYGEYHLVYNLAVSGETSRGILERLEGEAIKGLGEGLFDEVVVLGLIRVDKRKTCPVPWTDLCYRNERISVYDKTT